MGDFPHLGLDPTIYADNVWPDVVPTFEPAVATSFREVAALAQTLESVFEVALALPDGFFSTFTNHSIDVLRMNNYTLGPGTQPEPDQLAMGAHTDDGIVTIMWADPIVGLEVLGASGEWRSVVPPPGVLLVNVGDVLARWTNDRWPSPVSRVVPPIDTRGQLLRRRSAAFSRGGNADAVVSTLPSCHAADGGSTYGDITVAELRALRPSRTLESSAA